MTSRKRKRPEFEVVDDDDSFLSNDELLVDIIIVEEQQQLSKKIGTSHKFRVSRSLLASEESASILVPELLSNTSIPTRFCKRPKPIQVISKGVLSLPIDKQKIYVYFVKLDIVGLMEGTWCACFVRYEEISVDKAILFGLKVLYDYDNGPLCNNPCVGALKRIRTEKSIEDCAICLEEVPIRTFAALLPCSHAYHCHCIVKWLKKSNVCPLCRFHLPS